MEHNSTGLTEIIALPGLYLNRPVLVDVTWLAEFAHVTVGDVLAINLHTVDVLPHTVTTYSNNVLSELVISTFLRKGKLTNGYWKRLESHRIF